MDINKEVQRIRAAVRSGKDFLEVKADMVGVIKHAFPEDDALVAQLQNAADGFEVLDRLEQAPFGALSELGLPGAAASFDESPSASASDADSLVFDTKSRESSFISGGGASFCLDRSVSEKETGQDWPLGDEAQAEEVGEGNIMLPAGSRSDFQHFSSQVTGGNSCALLETRKQIYRQVQSRSLHPSPGSRRDAKDDPRQLLMRYFGRMVRRKLQQAAGSASQSVNSSHMQSSEVSAVLTSSDSRTPTATSPSRWMLELKPRPPLRPPASWRPRRAFGAGKMPEAAKSKARRPHRGLSQSTRGASKASYASRMSSKVIAERVSKEPSPRKPDDHEDSRWEKVKSAAKAKPRSMVHHTPTRNLEAVMVERSARKQVIRSERLNKAPEAEKRCEDFRHIEAWTPEPVRLSSSTGERDWTTGMARLAHTPDELHTFHLAQIWEDVARRRASVAEVRSRLEAPRPASQQALRSERAKPAKPRDSKARLLDDPIDVGGMWEAWQVMS